MRCCCGLFIWFLQVEISLIPSLDEFIWVPIHICKHEDIWFRTCVSSLFWGGNHGIFQSGGNCIWMGSLYDCSFSFTANSGQNGSQQRLPTAKPLRMEICFSPLSQMIDWLKMDRLTYRTQVFVCCYKKEFAFISWTTVKAMEKISIGCKILCFCVCFESRLIFSTHSGPSGVRPRNPRTCDRRKVLDGITFLQEAVDAAPTLKV